MRGALVLGLLLVTVAWTGCMAPGDGNGGVAAPFAGKCDVPPADGQSVFLGGIANPDGEPVQGVEVLGTPQDAARDEHTDLSNETGCYRLALEPDVVYDVTWQRDGYAVERQDAVVVTEGQARIQHVLLQPL